jgi:hypothetical protein
MKRTILRVLVVAVAVTGLAAAAIAQRTKPKEEGDAPELYPVHPNRDDAFYACTACHSFKIVAAQGMSRERWDESLDWMVTRHSMPKIEGKDREKVLDYLATVFPERRSPGGWKNPFAPSR